MNLDFRGPDHFQNTRLTAEVHSDSPVSFKTWARFDNAVSSVAGKSLLSLTIYIEGAYVSVEMAPGADNFACGYAGVAGPQTINFGPITPLGTTAFTLEIVWGPDEVNVVFNDGIYVFTGAGELPAGLAEFRLCGDGMGGGESTVYANYVDITQAAALAPPPPFWINLRDAREVT